MTESRLAVTGRTCAECARHVEQVLTGVLGVRQVRVDNPQGIARIEANPHLQSRYGSSEFSHLDSRAFAQQARTLLARLPPAAASATLAHEAQQ